MVLNGTTYIDCISLNVIYLITCNRYPWQYVGETVQKLNKRFYWQKTGFNQPGKYGFCCILSDHFHKVASCGASYSIQILAKLEGNCKSDRNFLDASLTCRRTKREKTWLLMLRTVYPCGLNDCLGDEYKKEDTYVLIGNKFPSLPRKHDRVSRGTIHKNNNSFSLVSH